jgi:hypothetical protein
LMSACSCCSGRCSLHKVRPAHEHRSTVWR